MQQKHDVHKHQIAIKFHHMVWRKIELAAAEHKMTPSDYIRWVLFRETERYSLSALDMKIIAKRIADAQARGKMV